MSRIHALLLVALALLASGALAIAVLVGDDEADIPDQALVVPDADVHLTVDLDYEGAQWREIAAMYASWASRQRTEEGASITDLPPTLDGALGLLGTFVGVSFEDDVKPVLGGELHVMARVTPAPALSAAQRRIVDLVDRAGSLERYDRAQQRAYEQDATPRAPTLVYVDHDGEAVPFTRAQVEAAFDAQERRAPRTRIWVTYRAPEQAAVDHLLDVLADKGMRMHAGAGGRIVEDGVVVRGRDVIAVLDEDGNAPKDWEALVDEAVETDVEPLPDTTLVSSSARPGALGLLLDAEQLKRFSAIPEGQIRSANLALGLRDGRVVGDGSVVFGSDAVPLGPPGRLRLPVGKVASSSYDQFHTTTYLAHAMRALYPDSRFVRRIDEAKSKGIDIEADFLRQFVGRSQTVTDEDGQPFLSTSTIRDPARMSATLGQVQPLMPGLLDSLQGLGNQGLLALLLVAPDAPTTPTTPTATPDGFTPITRTPDRFYQLAPPSGDLAIPALTYGLRDDAFWVGSDGALARTGKFETAEEAVASSWLRVDRSLFGGILADDLDVRLTRKAWTIQIVVGGGR